MRKPWLSPLIVLIIISLLGFIGYVTIKKNWESTELNIEEPIVKKATNTTPVLDLKSIIHEAEKNVLLIEGKNDDFTMTGSGFLYNNKGDIITNAHVIKDADVIYVRTANAHIYPAAIVGISEETDIAVIRVPQLIQQSFLTVETEKIPEIGDEIIALGSPHGFQNTVTLGIISGSERNFSVDGYNYNNVYQISAQITQGNSGGPLIDRTTGKAIGINSVGTEDGTLGFSIPISEVLDQIKRWSDEVTNDELRYASMSDVLTKYDPNALKEDADYLIEYFFDNIKLREYIDAYTLFGSTMQSEIDYTDFRETYNRIIDLQYEKITNEVSENYHSKTKVEITFETKSENENKNNTEKVNYTFVIGLENDQLKILQLSSP